jgi:hypothetical protein
MAVTLRVMRLGFGSLMELVQPLPIIMQLKLLYKMTSNWKIKSKRNEIVQSHKERAKNYGKETGRSSKIKLILINYI